MLAQQVNIGWNHKGNKMGSQGKPRPEFSL